MSDSLELLNGGQITASSALIHLGVVANDSRVNVSSVTLVEASGRETKGMDEVTARLEEMRTFNGHQQVRVTTAIVQAGSRRSLPTRQALAVVVA